MERPMVLETKETYMDPHGKVAFDLVAAAGALFNGDSQHYDQLVHRLQDAPNYGQNLELDGFVGLVRPEAGVVPCGPRLKLGSGQ